MENVSTFSSHVLKAVYSGIFLDSQPRLEPPPQIISAPYISPITKLLIIIVIVNIIIHFYFVNIWHAFKVRMVRVHVSVSFMEKYVMYVSAESIILLYILIHI